MNKCWRLQRLHWLHRFCCREGITKKWFCSVVIVCCGSLELQHWPSIITLYTRAHLAWGEGSFVEESVSSMYTKSETGSPLEKKIL